MEVMGPCRSQGLGGHRAFGVMGLGGHRAFGFMWPLGSWALEVHNQMSRALLSGYMSHVIISIMAMLTISSNTFNRMFFLDDFFLNFYFTDNIMSIYI